jgi:diacylglycerol kinase family enzyme
MISILINGRAGPASGPEAREKLEGLLLQALPDAKVIITGNGTDVTTEARRSVENGARMVVGGGGDGTLSAIAAVLAGTETPLGILPLGTLNHFAKDLGIPLEIEEAVATLTTGRITQVDVGEVNGSLFLNNSGLGLYPVIVHIRELRQSHGIAKWPAALWATCKAFARYERLSIRVLVEGRELRRRTPVVFIGNNEYLLGGVQLPVRDRLDDGLLSVYIPHAHGRFRLIWFSIRALFGKPRSDGDLDAFLTSELWIETRHRSLKVSLDGEVTIQQPPLHYRIRPQALRVVVPAEAAS